MGLLSSLFGGNKSEANKQEQQEQKNFDILKYDGIRARNMHQFAYAIRCLKEAIALKEDTEAMEYLASSYIATGSIEDARNVYNRLVELEPENIKVLLSLASVCFMLEDYTCMEQSCKKVIELDDKNQSGYYLAAKAEKGMKEHLQAIVMLTKAITCNEEFIEAYLLRAETLLEMSQPKEALKDIEVILSREAENEDALLLKGEIEVALENFDESFKCLERVISLNPFNEKAYILKGTILLNQKKFDESINNYDEALDLIPDNANLYKERGRAKLLKGDKQGSIADIKKSMELNPGGENQFNGNYNNFEQPKTGIY